MAEWVWGNHKNDWLGRYSRHINGNSLGKEVGTLISIASNLKQ